MCGRFVITSSPDAIRRLFGYAGQPNFPARHNIAPTQPVPVVMLINGVRQFQLMRWGLLPAWVKDARTFSLVINARAETAIEKPAFRNAIKRRRCLIPADGYYEWQHLGSGAKRPLFIYPANGEPMAFAALAETWVGPNGEELDTVAIVTIAASADLAELHHRMPAIIAPEAFDQWLNCRDVDEVAATPLLTPPPQGTFQWHEVSTAVNRTVNDDATLIAPITEAQRQAQAMPVKRLVRSKVAASVAAPKAASKLAADDGQGSLF